MGEILQDLLTGEKASVESMFDSIARRYDFLNHFLSFRADILWRRRAIKSVEKTLNPSFILDVATGTADFAIEATRLNPVKITGIDISEKMLELGRKKIIKKGLTEKIELVYGDVEHLPFDDNSFDLVMSSFGVRNFSDTFKGINEMARVLRKGSCMMILEFSMPSNKYFRRLFNFYFFGILPLAGRLFSGNKEAYNYLPDSVEKFPERKTFMNMMERAGLYNVNFRNLAGGIAVIYTGLKL
ncbi:MAG TPA: bifunctional demethylmenaquinone methyltransferase/2-methoxy-6-polyprenyl-1,4-benzoquinol methylase UbiE [Bacteroidales bacterium]|nr:bifunctional demethylmenaquinone methyltransferase/2-methoxy-6-polyprenyl-1,4-benzoquinol methylase UbiE [Bacteroidales bacterium]HOU95762.1 bifunctional demethylmenaquinone methyltransferase/2-methoxy-6-polyprenyl-1,4-benzoquinol methylase UbiE [Bacteroidales bacterium]HQG37287.1 bifunctional demethylmenaquinone methyltransferase/2-methoxy-6-polyprenyl-1,4-benzoquinol methylase UbiE [Bacteroidales bacterium]HQG52850.1 bifunctional demethylmenaquinone methyltransferase/2-methoxy-6-polyprenyl-